MMEDTIGQAFGLEKSEEYEETLRQEMVEGRSKSLVKAPVDEEAGDYELVRSNLKDLIATGTSALDELMFIAKQSQHPRSYEVLSQLIKTIGEQNKELINIQLKVNEGKKKDEPQSPLNVNNAIFVGSTKDLRKALKGDE